LLDLSLFIHPPNLSLLFLHSYSFEEHGLHSRPPHFLFCCSQATLYTPCKNQMDQFLHLLFHKDHLSQECSFSPLFTLLIFQMHACILSHGEAFPLLSMALPPLFTLTQKYHQHLIFPPLIPMVTHPSLFLYWQHYFTPLLSIACMHINNQPYPLLFFSRRNQQHLFNSFLMAPIFTPIYFTPFACSHAANNSYKTPSSPPLSLTQAPEKEHPISSPPSIRWAPSSSPFPHGCSSKSLKFFSNKMEPHDQSEYVMPLVLSSRHESNDW
jgi:hypothetical protein